MVNDELCQEAAVVSFKVKSLLMLIYVRALYNNCFIIPTSAQFLTH